MLMDAHKTLNDCKKDALNPTLHDAAAHHVATTCACLTSEVCAPIASSATDLW